MGQVVVDPRIVVGLLAGSPVGDVILQALGVVVDDAAMRLGQELESGGATDEVAMTVSTARQVVLTSQRAAVLSTAGQEAFGAMVFSHGADRVVVAVGPELPHVALVPDSQVELVLARLTAGAVGGRLVFWDSTGPQKVVALTAS